MRGLSGSKRLAPLPNDGDDRYAPAAYAGHGNIVIGVVFIAGGLTGGMTLRGTHSSIGLAVAGGFLVLLGVYGIARPS